MILNYKERRNIAKKKNAMSKIIEQYPLTFDFNNIRPLSRSIYRQMKNDKKLSNTTISVGVDHWVKSNYYRYFSSFMSNKHRINLDQSIAEKITDECIKYSISKLTIFRFNTKVNKLLNKYN